MGGVDVIVMTGGIGENSRSTRRRILQRLQFLGLHLDEDLNAKVQLNSTTPVIPLHASNSRTHAFAIATNEELMTAHETVNMLEAAAAVTTTDSIPIAISARHLHLNEANLKQLFGARAQLTKAKDISQPGQFACEQKVDLIGLKGCIDGVRVLRPLSSRNQMEISRTNEFRLGVDAAVRRSRKTKDSAPITLEGPSGKVDLDGGLICAWRHIHMTPADVERFGVESGDHAEVAISDGE